MNVSDTFTSKCPWGCTVHTVGGVTQPHTCDGTSQIVDLLRMGVIDPGQTYGEIAERLARGLDQALRVRLAAKGHAMTETESDLHSRLEERDAEIEGLKDEITRLKAKVARAADYCARPAGACLKAKP